LIGDPVRIAASARLKVPAVPVIVSVRSGRAPTKSPGLELKRMQRDGFAERTVADGREAHRLRRAVGSSGHDIEEGNEPGVRERTVAETAKPPERISAGAAASFSTASCTAETEPAANRAEVERVVVAVVAECAAAGSSVKAGFAKLLMLAVTLMVWLPRSSTPSPSISGAVGLPVERQCAGDLSQLRRRKVT